MSRIDVSDLTNLAGDPVEVNFDWLGFELLFVAAMLADAVAEGMGDPTRPFYNNWCVTAHFRRR